MKIEIEAYATEYKGERKIWQGVPSETCTKLVMVSPEIELQLWGKEADRICKIDLSKPIKITIEYEERK